MNRFFNTSNTLKIYLSVIIITMSLIGCASMPERNAALDSARAAYEKARANPEIDKNVPVAMHEAAQALQEAEKARNT